MTISKSVQDYLDELAEINRRLEEIGRSIEPVKPGSSTGIKDDLELPYSTLPKLHGERWH
ncbi:MAG: hypothetical protein OXE94_13305 [Aestuariivita sp.]|nr:hypothetical protein [Aestuariivita sp.]MCY4204050.1 hypothetical protein [Aestuariivita sp.]MCY4290076.1 hypothetical protein [Aestuariivita sp.]MCY4347972.1 hypothetical protein [Aestuariivita sp.]